MRRWIAIRIIVGIALHGSCAKASSILGSANTATVLNVAGSAVNVATGALNFNEAKKEAAKCASSDGSDQAACDKSALYYAMGTLNLAQAAAQAATAGSSSSTASSTDVAAGTTSSSDTSITSSGATTTISTDPEVAAGLAFAANVATNQDKTLSYNASTGTVTTAAGSTLSTSAVSSAGTSSGDSSSSLKSTMSSIASTEDQITAKAIAKVSKLKSVAAAVNGEEASAGGSAASGPPAVGTASEVKQGIVLAPRSAKITPVAASVEGLQKNFNGTPVGVAGDNIFRMVQRRYHLKDSQSTFLNESDLLK